MVLFTKAAIFLVTLHKQFNWGMEAACQSIPKQSMIEEDEVARDNH